LSGVATTLNNLGNLYHHTQQMKEAEASYQEALTIRRDLAKANPQAYLPYVADTLRNFGLLYFTQDKITQAHPYFEEEATIRRELWQAHPELHAEKFFASLDLNVLTLPQKETKKRCALLKEVWQAAPSAKLKMAVMAQDVKNGAPCKLHNLLLRAE